MHRRAADAASLWCILRTSPGRTLPLAASLAAIGFDVWTPSQILTRRRPRSKITFERQVPIAPSFVFARAAHLPDLSRILSLPVNPHPVFSIFRHSGRIPLIADHEIIGLRDEETKGKRAKLKTKRHIFEVGSSVRTDEPGFVGLTGVVEAGDGKFALVSFGGALKMKIATWLLHADEVGNLQPISGAAALAA